MLASEGLGNDMETEKKKSLESGLFNKIDSGRRYNFFVLTRQFVL